MSTRAKYWLYGIAGLLSVCVLWAAFFVYYTGKRVSELENSESVTSVGYASGPLSASYKIEDKEVALTDGRAETPDGDVVRVLGEPILADLNVDSVDDSILLLETRAPDASMVRTYLAIAISGDLGFFGSNAILLGSETYQVRALYDAITVSSDTVGTSSGQSEVSASSTASVSLTRYFSTLGATLVEFGPFDGNVVPFVGRYAKGGEESNFTNCAGEVFNLLPDSPALPAIDAIYRERVVPGLSGEAFMVVAGSRFERTADGEFDDMLAQAVLTAPLEGVCLDAFNGLERSSENSEIPPESMNITTSTSSDTVPEAEE